MKNLITNLYDALSQVGYIAFDTFTHNGIQGPEDLDQFDEVELYSIAGNLTIDFHDQANYEKPGTEEFRIKYIVPIETEYTRWDNDHSTF